MSNNVPRWRNPDPPWYEDQHLTIYDVPQIGPWVGKVGKVIDILSTPCSGLTTEIWVYAFWHAVPHLAMSLLKPDTFDFETARWGGSHRKKKNKRFNMLEELGMKNTPPKAGSLAWAVFDGARLAERIGWYMLVIDATIDFAVHWTSTAYQWAGCNTPGAARVSSHGGEIVWGPYAAGTYDFPGWIVDEEHIFAGDSNSVDTPSGYNVACGASFNTVPLDAPFLEASVSGIQIYDSMHDIVVAEADMADGYEGKRYARAVYRDWGTGLFAHSFKTRYTKGDGFFRLGPSQFFAYGDKERGLLSDP